MEGHAILARRAAVDAELAALRAELGDALGQLAQARAQLEAVEEAQLVLDEGTAALIERLRAQRRSARKVAAQHRQRLLQLENDPASLLAQLAELEAENELLRQSFDEGPAPALPRTVLHGDR